jgi:peptidyl-prolyl cis-trans isomerase D
VAIPNILQRETELLRQKTIPINMALISKIRQQGSWILIILIALGLGGFILMDMTSGQTSVFGSSQPVLAKINGQKIDVNDFNRTESILYSGSTSDVFARRENIWNYYLEKILVEEQTRVLGLGVSRAELLDLQFGLEPSPIITQRFGDQTTGQVNREQLNQVRQMIEANTLEPQMRSYWAIQEGEIVKDRLQKKLTSLVANGFYTPNWQAELFFSEGSGVLQFAYVKVPFDNIDNSEVSLSDEDYENYLEKNKKKYTNKEERRKIAYAIQNVFPTKADTAEILGKIKALAQQFKNAENDTTFVEQNRGIMSSVYVKKSEINPIFADSIFNLSKGGVFGPYIESGAYRVVKMIDKKPLPDSVKSRHILISATDANAAFLAQKTIDSLKTVIEKGDATFEAMAAQFGSDATTTKGGDLGYAAPGQMVAEFNDLIFFQAEPGKLYTVTTQFGVHLVEVTGKKFEKNEPGIRIASLVSNIVPSDATQKDVYNKVSMILNKSNSLDDLKKNLAKSKDMRIETSTPMGKNEFFLGPLGAGIQSRDIIRWAFDGDPGTVSPQVYVYRDENLYFDNKYVLIGLEEIIEEGLPSVDKIKKEIEPLVINEKKAEMIASKMKGKALESLASDFGEPIDTANGVTFANPVITGVGSEPKLLGKLFRYNTGDMTTPVIGNSGVYVAKIITKAAPSAPTELFTTKRNLVTTYRSQVNNKIAQVLKDGATIKDYRSKFF